MSVIGLDFGNLNGVVAVARKRGIDILSNEASRRTTATMVGFDDKNRSIGEAASIQQLRNLKNTIINVKRLIGRRFNEEDVQREMQYSPNKIIETADGGVAFEVNYDNEVVANSDGVAVFTPEQIVSMLLGQFQRIVDKETELKGGDWVISVPAYFTDKQRRAMRGAASIAGVHCLRLISENTAAALAYGLYKESLPEVDPMHVMFVDIGHSSLTVSIAAFTKGKVRIVASAFDRFLGGRDFDVALAKHFNEEFKQKYNINVESNQRAWYRMLAACEKLKVVLSANPKAPLNIECLMNDIDVKSMIERDEFNKMIASLVERALEPVRRVFADSGLDASKLHAVEVIGGSSRIPLLQEALKKELGLELSHTLDKSETVARGCALECAILSPKFRVREFTVQDCAPYSIEIAWGSQDAMTDEDSAELFKRHNVIPATKVITFNRTDGFRINARYSNPQELPGNVDPDIATFIIPAAATDPSAIEAARIKVKVRLDLSGLLHIESATLVETLPADPEPVSEVTADGAAAAAAAAAADGAATNTPAADAEPLKKKNKLRSAELCVQSTVFGELDNATIQSYFEKEGKIYSQDRLIIETAERKNDVETYVYNMRGAISEGGNLYQYCPDDVRASFLKILGDTEDWLYGDGEEAIKSVYVQKLQELKKIGDPIDRRYREAEARATAANSLLSTIRQFEEEARSTDDKYSHIEDAEKQRVLTQCAETQAWLDGNSAQQSQLPASRDPTLLSADINAKREDLVRVCRPILTKPKPAPPKEDPKPAPTPASPAPESPAPESASAEPAPAAGSAEQASMEVD